MKNLYSLLVLFPESFSVDSISSFLPAKWEAKILETPPELPEVLQESHHEPFSKELKLKLQGPTQLVVIEGPIEQKSFFAFFKSLQMLAPIACYCQSCGKTLLPDFIATALNEKPEEALIDLCVQFFWGEDEMLSQGMDTLELPDIGIRGKNPEKLQDILETIISNVLSGTGFLEEGQKFQLENGEKFRLKIEKDWEIPEGEVGHNPHGFFRLVGQI